MSSHDSAPTTSRSPRKVGSEALRGIVDVAFCFGQVVDAPCMIWLDFRVPVYLFATYSESTRAGTCRLGCLLLSDFRRTRRTIQPPWAHCSALLTPTPSSAQVSLDPCTLSPSWSLWGQHAGFTPVPRRPAANSAPSATSWCLLVGLAAGRLVGWSTAAGCRTRGRPASFTQHCPEHAFS